MRPRIQYFLFNNGLRVKEWVLRRFTRTGQLALVALAVSSVFGLDTNRTMAFQAFTFLVCLFGAALASNLVFRGQFRVERVLPRFATINEPLKYRVRVFNRTSRSWTGLSISEDLSGQRPNLNELADTPEPGEHRRNAFDRRMAFHRWLYLVARKRGTATREFPLPTLGPGSRLEATLELKPFRRGPLRLDTLLINRADPFGLIKTWRRVSVPGKVIVLPKRYPVPDLGLPGNRHYQQGGVALASSVGDSEEFVAMRDYRPGDPIRRIHWKSWAKTGRPIVKEHQDEFFVRHALILDTFQKEGAEDAFEEAVSLASSFACTVLTQESLLDLMFVGTEAFLFTAGRGLSQTEAMLEILASVSLCRDKPFSVLPPIVLNRTSYLSACILVFIAWDSDREAFVNHLRVRGMPVVALVVSKQPKPDQGLPEHVHWIEPGRIEEGLAGIRYGLHRF